jgi:hypothetical protein
MDITAILEFLGFGSNQGDNSELFGKTVLIIKGEHIGKHGKVVQLKGRKSVKVKMEKWNKEGVVRTSSIVVLPGHPVVIETDENQPNRQDTSIDVMMRQAASNTHLPSTPVAEVSVYSESSFSRDQLEPTCIAVPILCLGAKVRCVRGSHEDKVGIVIKIHPRMVTLILDGFPQKTVRVYKESVVVMRDL